MVRIFGAVAIVLLLAPTALADWKPGDAGTDRGSSVGGTLSGGRRAIELVCQILMHRGSGRDCVGCDQR